MGAKTKIQWTEATWNPVRGCSRVSPGCDNCYAMKLAYRFSGPGLHSEGLATLRNGKQDWTGVVREVPHTLELPIRWRTPRRVFVNSQSDLFHHGFSNEYIAAVFGVMAATPRHTYQILTKRAERMREWFQWVKAQSEPGDLFCQRFAHKIVGARFPLHDVKGTFKAYPWPLPWVWLGVSAENQETADERIPFLLETPATIRFVSAEPLLGPIDLRMGGMSMPDYAPHRPLPKLDWLIIGGESGPEARVCDVDWIRSLVKQCAEAEVPCFTKQLGKIIRYHDEKDTEDRRWGPEVRFHEDDDLVMFTHPKGGDPMEWPADLRVRQYPEARP